MSQVRKNIVSKVFKFLDNGAGKIPIDELKELYNADRHPDVLLRQRNEEEVLTEFLDTLDVYNNFIVHSIYNS